MKEINQLKKRLKAGEIVIGTWCILPSPSVVNVIASSGIDFLVIDMEHGPHSFETAEDMVRAAEIENCAPLIRVSKNDQAEILRALDIGAHGIIVPHIETAEQRKLATESIKYFPIGKRGFSPFTRCGNYVPLDITKHTERENRNNMVILLIESKKGMDSLDAIIDDENIDIVFLGAYDLSQALGVPGEVNHSLVKKYLEESTQKIKKRKIAVGSFTNDPDTAKWFIDIGMQFISYSIDATELCLRFKKILGMIKNF